MLWIVIAVVVVVVLLMIIFKTLKRDQNPVASLESRRAEPTNLPEDSRDEFRKEFLESKEG